MATRYFFHLTDELEILRDEVGLEVADLSEVETAAVDVINEFRRQHRYKTQVWHGWKMIITDSGGNVVLIIPLVP